jgi:predicted Rossmann fold nucleotide-binding protein DprA/Smf involved in DNA uptake
MTARLAMENSKSIAVLPGFPSETTNQGCVDLLFQNAFPMRDHEDLLVLYEMERLKALL